MDLHSLTTTQQVRAVLVVSEADLPDSVLETYGLDDDLGANLDTWLQGWAEIQEGPTHRQLKLYAKYFCAATLAGMAQTFILKKYTDGSNEGQRSDVDGFLQLAQTLWAKALAAKVQVLQLQDPAKPASAVTLMGVVTPSRDVITEGRTSVSE